MVVIWIRHAEKLYNNGKAFNRGKQHDSPLKIEHDLSEQIEWLAAKLIEYAGPPKKIIISPFLRTRQTAKIIMDFLKIDFDVKYSNDIMEYLGFCHSKNGYADLETETLNKMKKTQLLLGESIEELESRVSSHISEVKKSEENVWVITHGFVINKIYEIIEGKELRRVEPLEYLVLNDNKVTFNSTT